MKGSKGLTINFGSIYERYFREKKRDKNSHLKLSNSYLFQWKHSSNPRKKTERFSKLSFRMTYCFIHKEINE